MGSSRVMFVVLVLALVTFVVMTSSVVNKVEGESTPSSTSSREATKRWGLGDGLGDGEYIGRRSLLQHNQGGGGVGNGKGNGGNFSPGKGWSATCDRSSTCRRALGLKHGARCCAGKCTNLHLDEHNCGKCGRRCAFGQICCTKKCIDIRTNQHNCGRCGNKCGKGSQCRFGMCGYASAGN